MILFTQQFFRNLNNFYNYVKMVRYTIFKLLTTIFTVDQMLIP